MSRNSYNVLNKEYALKQLIEGCSQSDGRSEELLYKSFYGYVSSVIRRYIAEEENRKELVNDVFVKLFKNISRFELKGEPDTWNLSFKAWIGKLAANSAIDFLRLKKNNIFHEPIAESVQTALTVTIQDDLTYKELVGMLGNLDLLQRTVFNMHVIEGFSHDEIAAALSINPNSCRVYLSRAKNKLIDLYHKNSKIIYEVG